MCASRLMRIIQDSWKVTMQCGEAAKEALCRSRSQFQSGGIAVTTTNRIPSLLAGNVILTEAFDLLYRATRL